MWAREGWSQCDCPGVGADYRTQVSLSRAHSSRRPEGIQGHVRTLCIPKFLVPLGAVFSIHLCFLQRYMHIHKCKAHAIFELHPNIPTTWEQICVFRISIPPPCTLLVYKYFWILTWHLLFPNSNRSDLQRNDRFCQILQENRQMPANIHRAATVCFAYA